MSSGHGSGMAGIFHLGPAFALCAALLHWSEGLRLDGTLTPMSLSDSMVLRTTPFMELVDRGLVWPMCITLHLSTLNSIPQTYAHSTSSSRHFWRLSMSLWSTITLPSLVSSANLFMIVISRMRKKSMSLIKITKARGPRTEPWGTPDPTLPQSRSLHWGLSSDACLSASFQPTSAHCPLCCEPWTSPSTCGEVPCQRPWRSPGIQRPWVGRPPALRSASQETQGDL